MIICTLEGTIMCLIYFTFKEKPYISSYYVASIPLVFSLQASSQKKLDQLMVLAGSS